MPPQVPDPPLSDGVVALRLWDDDDVEALVRGCRDEEIARWLDQIPQPYEPEHARMYIDHCRAGWRDGTSSAFAIAGAADGSVLGSIGMRHLTDVDDETSELGYWVAREARGRGVATRALRLVCRWAQDELGIPRLQLRADELNEPSQRVAENVGFVREGLMRSCRYNAHDGRRVDFVLYSLLPGELK